jgi:hypothetical protein
VVFTQHVYSEAAEALMNKATAEGLPPGLFLPTVERDLARITADSSERAVNAANVLINKKMLGVALKVQSCFSGIALDAVTSLGLHGFGEWRMKLLTDSAGQDPKLVFKLTNTAMCFAFLAQKIIAQPALPQSTRVFLSCVPLVT